MSTGNKEGASKSTVVQGTLYASQKALNQESCESYISRAVIEMLPDDDEKSFSLKSTQNHIDFSLEKVCSRKDKQDHIETDSLVPQTQGDEQQVFQATDVVLQAASSQVRSI